MELKPLAVPDAMRQASINDFDYFNDLRAEFLSCVAEKHLPFGPDVARPSLIVVTHLLPDRPALLTVLKRHFNVLHIFGIPYSTVRSVSEWASIHFSVSEPTLSELIDGTCIERELLSSSAQRIILLDIGGYAAPLMNRTYVRLGDRLCGVIEGTESGYRRYSTTGAAGSTVPIVCMSLSPAKTAESVMVGPACLFSVDRILRSLGFTNEIKTAVVLGYGRIGRSVAEACRSRGLLVYVFDQEPERRVQALAEGFLIPERSVALARADIVLAATGQRSWHDEDARITQNGAFLISCSSKDVEFDFAGIRERHPIQELGPTVSTATICNKRFHFVYDGRPVNFSDGANLGPILPLIQAEMIAVCGDLLRHRFDPGIQAPKRDTRQTVIKEWFDHYLDMDVGWFRRRTVI